MTGAQYRCNCGRTDRRISNKCFGCGDIFTSDDQPQKPETCWYGTANGKKEFIEKSAYDALFKERDHWFLRCGEAVLERDAAKREIERLKSDLSLMGEAKILDLSREQALTQAQERIKELEQLQEGAWNRIGILETIIRDKEAKEQALVAALEEAGGV